MGVTDRKYERFRVRETGGRLHDSFQQAKTHRRHDFVLRARSGTHGRTRRVPSRSAAGRPEGTSSPVRQGRTEFRHTFDVRTEWHGTRYEHKELSVFAARENQNWIIVTVITPYF
jgi:hypothetical protein